MSEKIKNRWAEPEADKKSSRQITSGMLMFILGLTAAFMMVFIVFIHSLPLWALVFSPICFAVAVKGMFTAKAGMAGEKLDLDAYNKDVLDYLNTTYKIEAEGTYLKFYEKWITQPLTAKLSDGSITSITVERIANNSDLVAYREDNKVPLPRY